MALDLSALDLGGADAPAGEARSPEKAPTAHISQFVLAPNVRSETDPVKDAEMVADFRERGIMHPVLCARRADGMLEIHQGSTRFRLAPLAGIDQLPYLVTENPKHLDGYAQVAENQQRQPLTPLDLATFINDRIKVHKEARKDIAAKLHIDPSALTHLMTLVDAPSFILELYHSGKCRTPLYLYKLKALHVKNPKIVEGRVAAAEVIDSATLAEIAEEVEPKAAPAPAPAPASAPRDPLGAQGSEGGQAGEGGDQSASGSGNDDDRTQHVPGHNPDIEPAEGGRASDPTKLKKPLLLGKVDGRDVMVLLTKRPSAVGLVHVVYEDGTGELELSLDRLTLTMLTDSKKD